MKNYLIGIIIFLGSLMNQAVAAEFSLENLPEKLQSKLIAAHIWQPGCPVNLNELRLLSVSYYDSAGHSHDNGKMILHQSVAPAALEVFKQLYWKKFPFTSIETLVDYQGNWRRAEEDDVTYGFICKRDAHHFFTSESFGTVMTINPALNPEVDYLNEKDAQYVHISPAAGMFSMNRSYRLKGMSEPIQAILAQHGFSRLKLTENKLTWKKFIYDKNALAKLHHEIVTVITPKESFTAKNLNFNYTPLSTAMKTNLKKQGYWHEGCPLPLERLSAVTLTYYDFHGQTRTGNLIVFDALAPFVVKAFQELYEKKYPIESFDADNGNTSAFNCRSIIGKHSYSLHSYGLALDINVSRNPYIGSYNKDKAGRLIGTLIPPAPDSLSYLNRQEPRPGMNEAIVGTMAKYGFLEWGGDWQDRIDYMHFQVPTNIALHLAQLDKQSAEQLIELIIKYPHSAENMSLDSKWMYLYQMDPEHYMQALKKHFHLLTAQKETKVINLVYQQLALGKEK